MNLVSIAILIVAGLLLVSMNHGKLRSLSAAEFFIAIADQAIPAIPGLAVSDPKTFAIARAYIVYVFGWALICLGSLSLLI